ncbi:MAG: GNAT family N-acetyltransferase [Fuerstiella sp.]|nr:GNAT family N-acetyltransferase [Fuerstiella sp.]MCP4511411.1 GNAT family N-acetyltransferase [Fuerstiella sp.]
MSTEAGFRRQAGTVVDWEWGIPRVILMSTPFTGRILDYCRKNAVELQDITVFYLEMMADPRRSVPAPVDGLVVLHAERPPLPYYRFLYNTVGEDYHWHSRRILNDSELAVIIHNPRTEVHVVHLAGSPVGFAELNRGQVDEVELVQFGLISDFIGQGLGTWFLNRIIDTVWSYKPKRFWLHTCTLDHPSAVHTYKKAGFVQYKEEDIRRPY